MSGKYRSLPCSCSNSCTARLVTARRNNVTGLSVELLMRLKRRLDGDPLGINAQVLTTQRQLLRDPEVLPLDEADGKSLTGSSKDCWLTASPQQSPRWSARQRSPSSARPPAATREAAALHPHPRRLLCLSRSAVVGSRWRGGGRGAIDYGHLVAGRDTSWPEGRARVPAAASQSGRSARMQRRASSS
jgi:hypothetical protein